MSVLIDDPAWVSARTATQILKASNPHATLKLALVGEIRYQCPAGRNIIFNRADCERLARSRSRRIRSSRLSTTEG
jgi:hypothetical protein